MSLDRQNGRASSWAVSQGIFLTSMPVLFLADADIVHDPRHLSSLVSRLLQPRVEMVSEMVRLNCTSIAERTLVPAFVYFFQMLYPFAKVNEPRSTVAAAAGGSVLIRRATLERAGGIAAIRNTLIDDVALAKAIKRLGPIYLGHSALASSIRRYPAFADIWKVISRTAFTQLRFSAPLLALTMITLALIWLVPAWQIMFGHGWRFSCGLAAFTLAVDQLHANPVTLSTELDLISGFTADRAVLYGGYAGLRIEFLVRQRCDVEKPRLR